MKYSTYRFTLDLQKHQSQISIAVFQYDTAVRLYINLTDGGIPYHIADGCRAVFYGKRPDGTDLIHPCMIEGNTRIIYDFNDQTAYCEGTVDAQICLYGIDGDIITAPRLIIVASARTVDPKDINLSDSPLSALDQIFASETERETAELERVEAESERVEAEEDRVQAESERVEAEKQRGREAQKWVTGSYVDENGDTQNVTSEDPQFENNAVYYAGKAAESAESAKNYAEVIAPQEAEEAATEAANNVLSTVNNRLDSTEDRLDNVDYILEQFGAVKAQVDSSAALVKSIPARSDLFAYLNSVGGKTEAYRQLLNLPEGAGTGYYFWQLAEGSSFGQQLNEKITTVKSGVTIVNNGDGTFTINGTAEKYGTFALFSIYLLSSEDYAEKYAFSIPVPNMAPYLSFGGVSLPAGAHVYVGTDFGTDEGGSGGEVSATGGALSINQGWHICVMDLNFEAGTVFNNLTIKPMLNLGTTALPWQSPADPFTGLRSGKVTALKVYGANLLRYPYFHGTTTINGVTFTDNGDGTVTANGTATARAIFRCRVSGNFTLPKGAYTLSGCPSGGSTSTYYLHCEFYNKSTWVMGIIDTGASATKDASNKEYTGVSCNIVIMQGTVCNNLLFKPMINLGTKAASQYYPYKAEPTTYALPEAVKNLPLFGEGVTDSSTKITYANTVDLENKRYIEYLPEKLVFDGVNVKAKSESDTTVQRVIYTLPSKVIANRALNITHFNVDYADAAGNAYIVPDSTTSSLVMCPSDQSLNTLDKFNAWLKEMYDKGTPVEAVYAIATPEVADISVELGKFDPVLPVEGGGRIEFANDYDYDVPSTVTYNIIQEA